MFSTQIGNHLFIGKLTQARNPHIDIYLIDGQQNAQRILGKDFTLQEWGEFLKFIHHLECATPVAEGPAGSARQAELFDHTSLHREHKG